MADPTDAASSLSFLFMFKIMVGFELGLFGVTVPLVKWSFVVLADQPAFGSNNVLSSPWGSAPARQSSFVLLGFLFAPLGIISILFWCHSQLCFCLWFVICLFMFHLFVEFEGPVVK